MSRSDAGQVERSRVFEALLRKRGIQAPRASAIPRRSEEGPCVLSFAQERLWLLDQMAPGGSTYNMPTALRLEGSLDVAALAGALSAVARRHGALRTRFPVRDGVPVQEVAPPAPVPLPVADLSALRAAAREDEARRLVGEAVRRPFDLAAGPPVRALLLRVEAADHVALLTVHHIAGDGGSMEILVRELTTLYGSFARGAASPLPEPPIQYADFAVWQRARLDGEALERQLAFWRERLAGTPRLLELPSDRPRPAVQTFRGALRTWSLPAGLTRELRELGQRHGATLFVTLLAGFQALLARLSGQPDVLVGTPVAGRGRSELDGVIGVFLNTLVLRADLSGDPSFAELVEWAREASLAAQEHQELPFERLVEELAPERSLSHPPLVQVMFALQNAAPGGQPALAGLRMSPLEPPHETSKLDLALTLGEGAEELSAAFEYSTDLFDATTVARWAGHLERLLAAAVAAPMARLSDLPWLGPAERAQVLVEWNDTAMAAGGKALPGRVAAQARRAPDAVAVTGGELFISSAFLDEWAGRLAGRLRRRGAGPESVVGLRLPRSPEMVAAMLAVWRCGGAYLPLDAGLPPLRADALLADAQALPLTREEVWPAEGDDEETLPAESVDPERLAYVIYTSGSTGQPKGVAVSHGALGNLVDWHLREYGVTPADRASQVAGLGFDASVWEIWPYFAAGAPVHLLPQDIEPEPVRIAGWLAEAGITHGFLPTPLAEEVLAGRAGDLPALRYLLTGGDRLHRAPVEDPGFRLINHYGPTEGAVVATAGQVAVAAVAPDDPRPPAIGRPIANAAVRLLGRDLRAVPVGVAGELFLAGAGLARGYLHRPDLTAERFLPDPAAAEPGARVYRTGDLARWSPRGELEFLGRADFQVKVRGFRIETGEIEAALALHPRVREVAVVPREGRAGRRLVAYVVPAVDAGELRAFLRERLPGYMVPAAFVGLPALPLTPNGKVDRAALPDPPEEAGQGSVPPRNPVEEVIEALWAEALGRERVGIFDGFFDLGGHSLLAARVLARVRSTFGIGLGLAELFAEPTVAGFAGRVAAALRSGGGALSLTAPLVPVPRDRPLPQSFAQQRLWFLDRLEPGSPAYNVPLHLRLAGELSVPALAGALAEVARRHEVLRTTFDSVADEPVQIVGPPPASVLPVVDLTVLPPSAREAEAGRLADRESLRPFDLRRGPVFRVTLLRLAADDHALLATLHHIAADAWSVEVLRREIAALYAALRRGRPSPLPELPVQYGDFAVWQRRGLESGALEGQMEYWRGRLGSEPTVLELPTDRPRPAVQTYRGAHLPFTLPPDVAAGLLALGRRAGATPFMTSLAVFQGLLRRTTGQRDVSVGTPVSGRHHVELEGLIGFFLNTLVIRADLPGDPVFAGLLDRVRDLCLEAYAHQDLPFEHLVDELQPRRSLSHSPLFQVLFVLQHAAPVSMAEEPGWSPWVSEPAIAKFDLTLSLAVGEQGLQGSLEYNTDLFDAPTAARLVEHFERLAGAAVAAPGRPLSALPLLGEAERQQLLMEWNDAGGPLAADPALHRLVEEQARRTPDAVALVLGDEALTYAGLDHRAGRLARHLRALGVGPDARVGLAVERSLEMAAGLLAIFKAGGAYVPLDPAYPRERLGHMLADAGVEVLVTQAGLLETTATALKIFRLDADWGAVPAEPAEPENRGAALTGEELAYVIFTSGSTGRPKAVALSHRALRNLIDWHLATLLGGARTLQFASLSFDASFHEMFACWGSGGTLYLVSEEVRRDVPALACLLLEAGIEKAILPVVVLHQLAEELGRRDALPPLREVTTTGEQLQTTAAMAGLFRHLPGCAFHNHYGPSESHVATAYTLSPDPAAWGTHPSIGLPIWNSSVHLLGRDDEPVPIGVPGDLYIGGVCLARGYLGRPDLTAGRFVPDPFAVEPGARLYRTGDKVRRLPDGNLDFLGRFDHQVKVRGFRVELEEIESVLGRHPGVRQTVVLARGEGAVDKSLVAYVVPDPANATGAMEWRAFLRERLPDYMMPGHFVVLEALPLNANGKVDRGALPAPAADRPDLGFAFAAPRNPTEEVVAAVWADLLGIERVGVHDDFFALGGHSLMATRVVSRLRDAFQVELPLRGLFEAPTVAGLAGRVAEAVRAGAGLAAPPIVPVRRGDEMPLSFAQQRLWFIEQLEAGSSHYNVATALRLRGLLVVEALAGALAGIVRRHEVLRTSFPNAGGRPVQAVAADQVPGLPVLDLSSLPEGARQREVSRLAGEESGRPFDLAAGPLLRTSLVRLGPAEHVLLLCVHHIVWDGWSEGIFVRELAALYGALAAGRQRSLPELPVQYADFACWQRRWLSGEVLERQLAYWRQRLAGAPTYLDLPADRPRPAAPAFRGGALRFGLPAPASASLAALSRRHGATLFMTLAAAVDALLHRWTGAGDVVIGTPVAGRDRLEVEGLIGFFVNSLVLRTDLSGDPSFPGLLERVRDGALGAYAHQDLPFERLVEELAPDRSRPHSPLFQVLLALQNAPAASLDLPGIELEPLALERSSTRFDLTLSLSETAAGISGTLVYSADLFDAATAARMVGHLGVLLEGIAVEPTRRLSELPVLAAAERRQLLEEWNQGSGVEVEEGSLFEVFAARAAEAPDAVAVTCEGRALSYGALRARAEVMAEALRRIGVGPESRVGLCVERSEEMIVGIVGILAAGGMYVPLDPAQPQERLELILRDALAGTAAPVVVTGDGLGEKVGREMAEQGIRMVDVGEASLGSGGWPCPAPSGAPPLHPPQRVQSPAPAIPRSPRRPRDVGAYVIYTSGSTGTPKGVVVSQGNVLRLFEVTAERFGFGAGDVWTLFHSFAFDFSVWEIWGALLYGGRLVVVPQEVTRSPGELHRLLVREGVTVLNQTPSAFGVLAQAAETEEAAPLRLVVFGGEAVEPAALAPWCRRHGDERPALVNMYGITETTVHVTWRRLGRADLREVGGSPIGAAIPDLRIYVLDGGGQPVPVGVPGEIHVGGAGLARGYLGRPDLTAARFIPDAWSGRAGERLYRTGDLARYRPDGDLEFLGRIDHQVKIRGFRIEPGEIEAALLRHPGVRQAVVLAGEGPGGGRRLVAYVVPRPEEGGDALALAPLRAYLASWLPDYMLPAALVVLGSLPLTANGKVDRRALAALRLPEESVGRAGYEEPATFLERYLAGLWRQALGTERIGRHDDFFALGGNSISGAILINRLQRELGEIVHVVTIFDAPTVAGLAGYLVSQHREAVTRVWGWESLGEEPVPATAANAAMPEARVDADKVERMRQLIKPLSSRRRA